MDMYILIELQSVIIESEYRAVGRFVDTCARARSVRVDRENSCRQ